MFIYHAGAMSAPRVFDAMEELGVSANILVSYFEIKQSKRLFKEWTDLIGRSCVDKVFLDSGAFSAWSRGQPLKNKDYLDWLADHIQNPKLAAIAALDVIGDEEASISNYIEMAERFPGYIDKIVFTWHVAAGLHYLKQIAEIGPYVAFGGMVPFIRGAKFNNLVGRLRAAFSLIPGKTRVHGFGLTRVELLVSMPWFSADSTSAIVSAILMGRVYSID